MPLLLQPGTVPAERLRAMFSESRAELEELLRWVRSPPSPPHEVMGLRTAEELLESVLVVSRSVGDGAPPETLGAVVNLQYEAQLAVIDLVKMHTDLPKVPRRGP